MEYPAQDHAWENVDSMTEQGKRQQARKRRGKIKAYLSGSIEIMLGHDLQI